MLTYKQLYKIYTSLDNKVTSDTPEDLVDLLEEIERQFQIYHTTSNGEKQSECLETTLALLQQYYDLQSLLKQVQENSITTPDYNTLHKDDDEDTPPTEMGVHGEDILEKLHRDSGLRRKDNRLHQIFVQTIGYWLDEWDSVDNIRKYFLKYATDEWLDEYGNQYNVARLTDETDDSYRNRILQHISEHFTVPTLKNHGVKFFTYVDDPLTQLTSTNTYLSNNYLCYSDDKTEQYYEDNYICGEDITWL